MKLTGVKSTSFVQLLEDYNLIHFRLKELKRQLETAKSKGAKDLPGWLQEHDKFQQMLNKVRTL
jgi:hypothetical protein